MIYVYQKKFNYIPIQLIIPDGNIPRKVKEGCEYINIGFYLSRNAVIGALDEKSKRSDELNIWKEIYPDDGKYIFELIVELPFFLPNFKKSFEYDLSVGDRTYFVNNRQCEIIETQKKNHYLFAHYNALKSPEINQSEINQVIKLKSLVSTKFVIKSKTASSAIENEFFNWIDICKADISKIISTLRYCASRLPELIPDCTNIENTCSIYLLCLGKDKKVGLLKFLKHLNASPLQPLSHIEKTTKPKIEKYLNGSKNIDEGKNLILKSKQLFESGEYQSSCIIACTACEVIMTKQLKLSLKKKD